MSTSTDSCKDGDVRLVDGDSSNEGRVEVCLRRRWGFVSDEEWSAEDAQVVCNQLGFSAKGSSSTSALPILLYIIIHTCYTVTFRTVACSCAHNHIHCQHSFYNGLTD